MGNSSLKTKYLQEHIFLLALSSGLVICLNTRAFVDIILDHVMPETINESKMKHGHQSDKKN